MEALLIKGRINSPDINFEPATGLLKIIGRSIPENPVKFYQPIEGWLCKYLATKPAKVVLYVHLDYLNTHSTECVLILMKKIEGYLKSSAAEAKVSWNYDQDDEDMLVLGEDLASIVTLPFEYHEIIEEE